jgi:hypothetical protein
MANNLIQIKRSLNTATPTSLANGELAFSANGNHLFIGSPNGSIIAIGGLQVPGILTANQALVANATSGIDKVITANAVITTLTANGTTGTAGQILNSNGSVAYWANPAPSSFTITGETGSDTFNTGESLAFAAANGISTAVTNNQVTFSVDTGSTLTVNTNGIHVNTANLVVATSQLTGDVALGSNTSGNYVATITAGNGISGSSSSEGGAATIAVVAGTNGGLVSNSSGVFIAATDGLVANATGLHVGSGNGISTSVDAVRVNGGSTLTVNTSGVHVNSALSITDLSLSGNLTVLGTLSTVDTTNLTVKDSLIELANGNSTTDILDVGLYGQFGSSGTKFTGLFRDATDGIYKLFTGLTVEPTTTVDTSNASYTIATLQTFLTSGGLVSNATNLALTANSTCNVAIVANNISWSGLATNGIIYGGASGAFTSLSAGAGGTVLMVSTAGVPEFATLDGGTF